MKNPRTVWIVYTALRLLFFAVPFAVLYLLGIWPWLSAIFAALIGFSLSIIFLSRPRDAASESIYEWRNRERTPDSIIEDEAADAAEAGAGTTTPEAQATPAAPTAPEIPGATEPELPGTTAAPTPETPRDNA